MDDYYEVLQVSQRADPEVIQAAYKRLAFKNHPDRNPGNASAEGVMKRLNAAWDVLNDPASRMAYDQKLECLDKEREETQTSQKAPHDTGSTRASETSSKKNQQVWPPYWVERVAFFTAFCGGFPIFILLLQLLMYPSEGFRELLKPGIIKGLAGASLALAEGIGLTSGKAWAVTVPLFFCLPATLALGAKHLSNLSNGMPDNYWLFALLLAVDLFFLKARRAFRACQQATS